MIIHTGLRTDIPAFYSTWFLNRLEAGFVLVRNPYRPTAVTRYRLSPDVVDLISFCTKNPAPMLPHMDALERYGQYWFVTITPYGREVEPNVPDKEAVMEAFKELSGIVGADSVGWRYDPVFVSETYPVERHLADFEMMAGRLSGYTRTCVISFIDLYQKVRRNFPQAREVGSGDRIRIGKAFAEIGKKYGMVIKACAEGNDLEPYGVDCSGCMTIETYEAALHGHLDVPKVKPARAGCACYLGSDIGAYHSCGHLCRYCYANYDARTVKANMGNHDPDSPFLLGHGRPEDVVRDAKQKSWRDWQISIQEYGPSFPG